MSVPLTHLCWFDLLTTGARRDLDLVIEVAAVVTDISLAADFGTWSSPVGEPSGPWSRRLEQSDYALNRNVKSGLVGELVSGRGITEAAADAELLALVEGEARPQRIALAGFGVKNWDRWFVNRYFPRFNRHLAPFEIDVSMLRRFVVDVCLRQDLLVDEDDDEVEDKTHRAPDNVRRYLDEARHFQKLFRDIPFGEQT